MSKINRAVFGTIVFINLIPLFSALLAFLLFIVELDAVGESIFVFFIQYGFLGMHIIDTAALIIYYVYNLKHFKIEKYFFIYSLIFIVNIMIDFFMTDFVYFLIRRS